MNVAIDSFNPSDWNEVVFAVGAVLFRQLEDVPSTLSTAPMVLPQDAMTFMCSLMAATPALVPSAGPSMPVFSFTNSAAFYCMAAIF